MASTARAIAAKREQEDRQEESAPRPRGDSGDRRPRPRAGAGVNGRGRRAGTTAEPADLSAAILATVRRVPGLTCEGVAQDIAVATGRVKPHLAALVESGQLRKVGRTRGTRYHPA